MSEKICLDIKYCVLGTGNNNEIKRTHCNGHGGDCIRWEDKLRKKQTLETNRPQGVAIILPILW